MSRAPLGPVGRRLRARLLAWSAPVVALLVCAAAYLLFLSFTSMAAVGDAASGAHGRAEDRFDVLTRYGALERWKAPYGRGTERYAQDDAYSASVDLERAWQLVPHRDDVPSDDECRVSINLSLSYEALGDDASAAGDGDAAIDYWTKAVEASGRCTPEARQDASHADADQSQQAGDANERQQAKLDQQQSGGGDSQDNQGDGQDDQQGDGQDQQGDGGDGEQPPSPSPDGGQDQQQSEEPSDIDQIRDRNQDANDQRSEDEQSSGGGSGGGQAW